MERKKRSPLLAIVLAAAVCLLVIALLTGFIRPVPVIVAPSYHLLLLVQSP